MNYQLNISSIFCLLLLLLTSSCTEEVATKPPTPNPVVTTPPPGKSIPITAPNQNKPIVERQVEQPKSIIAKSPIKTEFVKCTSTNKILPENILELPLQNVTIFIGANKTTLDENLGESHRIFEVKSSPTCEVVFSKTLPINVSADFPYYLSKDAYNENLGLIGIRGFNTANVFDVNSKKLSPELKPKFLKERELADATSGMISHLFFDQNFLYGYAVDFGVFVFDMKNNGKAVLPIKEVDGTQLFAFNRSGNQVDFIIPIVTFTKLGTLDLTMKNVFERSINTNPTTSFKSKNKKYVILKEETKETNPNQYWVVDMSKKKRVFLPEEIAASSPEKILTYLK